MKARIAIEDGRKCVLRITEHDLALLSRLLRKSATVESDLSRSGIEILSAESDAMPVKIATTMGYLILDFEALELALDTGRAVSHNEVLRACEDYWTEWSAKHSKRSPPQ